MIQVKLTIVVEVDPADLNGHPGGPQEEVCDIIDDIFKVGPVDHALGLISVDPATDEGI